MAPMMAKMNRVILYPINVSQAKNPNASIALISLHPVARSVFAKSQVLEAPNINCCSCAANAAAASQRTHKIKVHTSSTRTIDVKAPRRTKSMPIMTGNVRSVNAATAMPIAAKVKKPPKPSSVNDVRSAASPRTIMAKILVAMNIANLNIGRKAILEPRRKGKQNN